MIGVKIVYFAVFVLLIMAIFVLAGLHKKIAVEHRRGAKAGALRLKKQSRLVSFERNQQRLLAELRLSNSVYWLMVAVGVLCGAAVGKLFFYHPFFAVIIASLGALGPQLYLRVKVVNTRSCYIEKLHASMMILSNSYIVTEDFLRSVQDNIDVLEYPAPFKDFLTYVTLLDGNIKAGLCRMERQVHNAYFSQWVDVLVLAQDNRSMKYVTMSIVDMMGDMRQVQRESDTAMYTIWREYFTVLALIFSAPLIFKVLMRDAYTVLVTTLPGQALLTLLLAAVVFSVVQAVKLNRPLMI